MTVRQREILVYLRTHLADHGYAPTVRELASHLGSKNPEAAACHLRSLESAGYIRRGKRQARVLVLTEKGLAA